MALDMSKTQSFPSTDTGRAIYAVPRVNLLPDEIFAERRLQATQIGLGAATLAVVGALVGGYLVSAASVDSAEDQLAAEQTRRTDTLRNEEAKYAEVPKVLAEVEAAQTARSQAMITDVLWADQLNALASSYPKTTWLRDMTVSLGVPVAAAPAAGVAVTPTGHRDAHLQRNRPDPLRRVRLHRCPRGTPGYSYPYLTVSERSTSRAPSSSTSPSTVNLTADVLSHRYDPKAS